MARPAGARPLPNPPPTGWSNPNSNSNYGNGSNESREAAWYEHEERMRPSYIQQPHRNFSSPNPIMNNPNLGPSNLPPLSPSARYQYQQQQQQQTYLPFPNSGSDGQQFYQNGNGYQQQQQQQMPAHRTFSNPQPPRNYQDSSRPPLSRSSQSRLASNDLPHEFSNQNLNARGKGSAFMVSVVCEMLLAPSDWFHLSITRLEVASEARQERMEQRHLHDSRYSIGNPNRNHDCHWERTDLSSPISKLIPPFRK